MIAIVDGIAMCSPKHWSSAFRRDATRSVFEITANVNLCWKVLLQQAHIGMIVIRHGIIACDVGWIGRVVKPIAECDPNTVATLRSCSMNKKARKKYNIAAAQWKRAKFICRHCFVRDSMTERVVDAWQ